MLPDILQRVVNAKYILERAFLIQDEESEAGSSIALLLAHDAVEMLMLAALDHVGAKPSSKRNFMDFWADMKRATDREPGDRIPLESLNKLRVGLKHNGNQPHQQTVKALLPRCKGFFENVLSGYCNLQYASISLLDLIGDLEVAALIKKAEESFSSGQKDHAMMHLKFAYYRILDPVDRYLPLITVPKKPPTSRALQQLGLDKYFADLSSFLSQSVSTTNANILKVDHANYMEYNVIGPGIIWSWAGIAQVQFMQSFAHFTAEDFSRWKVFLVDFALKAQSAYLPDSIADSRKRPEREYFVRPNE
ncbi:MAG: hypothetical protein ACRYGF_07075 [Janthinobacterium lividum]